MSTEHEGVDRSPEERRDADPTAPGDRVPPVASPGTSERAPGDHATAPPPPAAPAPTAHPAGPPPAEPPPAPRQPPPHPAAAPAHPAHDPNGPAHGADYGVGGPGGPAGGQDGGGYGTGAHETGGHGTGGYGAGGYGGQVSGGGPAQPWGAPPPPPAPKKRRGGLIAALAAGALLAGGVGGGVGFFAAERSDSAASETVHGGTSGEQTVQRAPDSVAGIAADALPSVVTIEVDGGSGTGPGGGTGTGFVFDKQGHILTNNHVVASAARGAEITTVFSDGKQYDAEVVGRAEGYDVAVIKLTDPEGADLTPLPLGDSDEVAVGDSTIAIGAPFGLSGTVTTGIVSALNRPVASSDAQGSAASYMSALQTDASINPGNSGGPLLNADGEVIGVNSAIQSPGSGPMEQAGSVGLGFAIPVDQAERVAKTLIETGEPVYPIIGATVEMSQGTDGAVIADGGAGGSEAITPGGPADEAGLRPGDVITKFDGTVIDSGPTLISEIWTHAPGDRVTLTYERDGQSRQAQLTLDQRVGDD
ncbi:trypsin-like peptidase domain-containing protein [Streptomyces sp. TRM70308]|uniref:S1C family serine protease n=1 Tax=Streptomyces sp. TRM70308 TaxID=3131932 RepID=UPI003D053BCD